MTLRERQEAMMNDLIIEREMYPKFRDLYDRKIVALLAAMGGGQ